jgi:hypothetical protein
MFWRLTLLAALPFAATLAVRAPVAAQSTRFAARSTTHSVHWDGISLGEAVERIRRTGGANVVLDRRVDPNRRVTLSVSNALVDEVIAQLAAECALGVGRVGELDYLGPRDAAEGLSALAAQRRRDVARLPDELRHSLTQRKRIAWPRLTEPREMIARLATEHGWRIENAERIPFDLWPAGQLPRLALSDQLTVLLAGFDLTYRLVPDKRAIEIVPVDWSALEPRAAVATPRRSATTQGESRQTYTLRVQEQPVGAVLTQLAQRLGWKLDVDEAAIRAAGRSMDERASFAVENADADQLLEAILAPAGLTAERTGERVRVFPQTTKTD